jgi:predicted permease
VNEPRFFPRRPSEAEIARELSDHLELEAEELMRSGMAAGDAQLEARRRFGNVASLQESTRESWGSLCLERLQQDLRFGARVLRRSPIFSIIAVACLGLGLGAYAAVRSWTEAIIRHPFPGVRDQDQLVAVVGTVKGGGFGGLDEMSYPDFADLARSTTALSGFFVAKITSARLTGGDRMQWLVGQLVTANYFDALGVRPILGRGFLRGEDIGNGAHPVVVISYGLWRDRFGSDRNLVGAKIDFNGVPHTVVGIAPDEFLGTFAGYAMQFWVPASQQGVFDPSGYKLEDRRSRWVEGFARLKPGVTLAAGQVQADAAARRLAIEFPNDDRGRGVRLLTLRDNPFDYAKVLKPMLRVAAVVALLVLVIVCANISNLLLVRALARTSELSVRRALGASRGRLARQLVTEGLILALLGTAVGLVIAYGARHALGLFFAPRNGTSLVFSSDFNWRVIASTIAIGLGSTLLFALAPALQTTPEELASAMRATAAGAVRGTLGRGRGRLRAGLVIVQVTLSVQLLIAAALRAMSVDRMLHADPGFAADDVRTTAVHLFGAGYDSARAYRFEDELLLRARALSGVSSAALANSLPFSTRPYDSGPMLVDGYEPARDEQPTADYNQVSPDYFRTLGIPLLSGRDFTMADADTSSPVAIVSRALAQRYWPNASPIGRRIKLGSRWRTVVGMVADAKYRSLTESPGTVLYIPLAQERSTAVSLFLHIASPGVATRLTPSILAAFHAIDPSVSPYEVLSMREQISRSTSSQQIMVTLLVIFSGVGLFLAAMGLYGVISYMVSQSTRELGVRMALGAAPLQLLTLVLSSGLRMTLIGIALGVVVALGTTRLLGDLLFMVNPRDPAILMFVTLFMAMVAVAACLVPASRAARLDAVRALRA